VPRRRSGISILRRRSMPATRRGGPRGRGSPQGPPLPEIRECSLDASSNPYRYPTSIPIRGGARPGSQKGVGRAHLDSRAQALGSPSGVAPSANRAFHKRFAEEWAPNLPKALDDPTQARPVAGGRPRVGRRWARLDSNQRPTDYESGESESTLARPRYSARASVALS
jgi:hypothetical protein